MKTYLCPLTKNTTMRKYNWDLIPAGRLRAPTIDDNRGLIQATLMTDRFQVFLYLFEGKQWISVVKMESWKLHSLS